MSRLRVRVWAHCYHCHRSSGLPGFGHPRPGLHLWLWSYTFTLNGVVVYKNTQFRTWQRATRSAAKHYPRIKEKLNAA